VRRRRGFVLVGGSEGDGEEDGEDGDEGFRDDGVVFWVEVVGLILFPGLDYI
jgi:hypothetical protein